MRKIELLSPAGSKEAAIAAINAGADAVYIGGRMFGARAYAKNPEEEDLIATMEYAHIHGSRVYLTVNTLLKDLEMGRPLYDFLLPYYEAGLDGVIVQDLGVMHLISRLFPGLPIHCSTQMNICDLPGAIAMKNAGASRVVLARELSLQEIKEINNAGIETECFIHGALCYCYSGRCLMSSILGGRSGNRGRCAQPCRLPYTVNGKKRYVLSPKDLCTIEHLPDLIEAGIYSFKIEGRMKRAEYTAAVTEVYRKYFDLALNAPAEEYRVSKEDMDILLGAGNRKGFTKGYYYFHNGNKSISYDKPDYDTADEAFFEAFRNKYIDKNPKEKIKGIISLHKGKEALLKVSYKGKDYSFNGSVADEAKNAPLSEDKIREQISKTGDTPFEFEKLEVEADRDIFMPVKALNELRREALRGLTDSILAEYKREGQAESFTDVSGPEATPTDKSLSVYIESLQYLDIMLRIKEVSRIYVSAGAFKLPGDIQVITQTLNRIKEAGKEACFALPHILRRDIRAMLDEIFSVIEGFDGVLVRNIDEAAYIKDKGFKGEIAGDYSLYTYNREAALAMKDFGIENLCAPLELNAKELKHAASYYTEMVGYGYIPLMVTTQCVRKTLGEEEGGKGCDKSGGIIFLKDRYNKSFGVKSFCDYCYNVIYNSTPLVLHDKADEIRDMGIGRIRLDFTYESVEEAEEIMRLFTGEKKAYDGEFTRGHYSRGVE